jgi:excisionase family DNA binding protein
MTDDELLSDFCDRMSTSDADSLLGVKSGTVAQAIRRGEIKPYRMPGAEQVRVSRRMLAAWVRDFCTTT